MSYDFINQLGIIALAPRLKRLSEAINQSNKRLYKFFNFEIEPSWLMVFKLLQKYDRLTVTEIARKLHFSHPSVITMVAKIKEKGLLETDDDPQDSRRKFYRLSQEAVERYDDWNRIWMANGQAIHKLIDNQSYFLEQIEKIEIRLSEIPLEDATMNELNGERNII